ncbi:MAG: hypothetical protein ACTSR8_06720 [Promethearchaeota archaeon]
MLKDKIIGSYHTLKYRTKVEAHEYLLDIEKSEENIVFKLNHAISGHFGSLGNEWVGECEFKESEIIFTTNEFIDWRYTFLEDERQDRVSSHNKSYIGKVNFQDSDIMINLQMETQSLILYKFDSKVRIYTAAITRQIIKNFNLDNEYGKFDEPGLYWRISNLIIKNLSINTNTQEVELICEYDLDTVKEEKRVNKMDEVEREHHIERYVFEKNSIKKFETVK